MGTLSTIQSLVADRLSADPYFADIPVFTEKKLDFDNEIARALGTLTKTGGKIGACAIAMTPDAGLSNPNVPGPYLDPVRIVVEILELPLVNMGDDGTQKPASDIAETAAQLLHQYIPAATQKMIVGEKDLIRLAPVPAEGHVAYHVNLYTQGQAGYDISQAATPAITPDNGSAPISVELSCATTGAAIFYTTNGKFPNPQNGTLYSSAIEITEACTLNARAYLAGYLDSEVATGIYT